MNSTQTKSFLLLFKYSFLIVLAACLPLGECLYIPPVWLTSSYLQADSCKIISTRTGNDSTPTATLLFRTSFSQTPNIGYGISSY